MFVPPWINGPHHARLVRLGFPFRALVGVAALALTPALPEPRRGLFVILVGLVYLPYSTALLLVARKHDGPLVRLATVGGDIAVVFMFVSLIPRVSVVGMFGYLLLVAHYTHLGGRTAGLLVAASGFGFTWLGLGIAGVRIDGFTLGMYAVVLAVLVLLFDVAGSTQRAAAARLRELDRLKSDFIASVSHELRTPLTSIEGFAHTLQRKWDHLDEDERREFLDIIARDADHLRALIEDLLDFSSEADPSERRPALLPPRPGQPRPADGHDSSPASSDTKDRSSPASSGR